MFDKKLNISNQITWGHHHSGWNYVIEHMKKHFHNPKGVKFIGYLDVFLSEKQTIEENWIGVFHNTPYHPQFDRRYTHLVKDLSHNLKSKVWHHNQKKCKGIITLSNYTKNFIQKRVSVPVEFFYHPIQFTNKHFNIKSFLFNKKIIMLGHWMRNFKSFYKLKVNYPKIIVKTFSEDSEQNFYNPSNDIQFYKRLSNNEYENILQNSLVFLNLIDASANNVVIECIVRKTPILINKLPGIIDYLGYNYPFYYTNIEEANYKANNNDLIKETHNYLKNYDVKKLMIKNFISNISKGVIYSHL